MSHQAASKTSVDDFLATVKSSNILEMPCLGHHFKLGMLYDCRTDSMISDAMLWDSETLKTATFKTPLESSDFEVIAEDTFWEKTSHLGVGTSMKLSLLSGMVNVDGAAKFLNDQKSSKKQVRVSLMYNSTTTFEQLRINELGNFEFKDVIDKDTATHVVTGIIYGADAFFVFDRGVEDNENSKKVHEALKEKVGKLPDKIGDDTGKDDKIHCEFYGDLVSSKHPATFHNAAKVYQELPELLKEKSIPKRVWLYPLDSRAQKMACTISSKLTEEFCQLMESLHEITMRSNDLILTEVCSYFHSLKEELENLNSLIREYKTDLKKSLATLLPSVRGGSIDEEKFEEIIKNNTCSPFSRQSLQAWISRKENEVKILCRYLQPLIQHEHILLAFESGGVDNFVNDF